MLTQKQFSVLVYLTEQTEAPSQRSIAEGVGLSVGTVNKILSELNEMGALTDGLVNNKGYEILEPYRAKRAIFMAAGMGERLIPITLNTPKPLVRVKGKRIIDTLLDAVLAAGIEEIYIVRGYLAEQFDQLLKKYPMIKFLENREYNQGNNILSALCARSLLKNAYMMEADLLLSNPKLIQKYQYQSNYLGIPIERTNDWCIHTEQGIIKKIAVGGVDCHQTVGISYWTAQDGEKLEGHIKEVCESPGGRERFWGEVPLVYFAKEYSVAVRDCKLEDIVEIDTFNELKAIDPAYNV